jgi:hypothetical protein
MVVANANDANIEMEPSGILSTNQQSEGPTDDLRIKARYYW